MSSSGGSMEPNMNEEFTIDGVYWSCTQMQQLMIDILLSDRLRVGLSPDLQQKVQAHLRVCTDCATAFPSYDWIDETLKSVFLDPPFAMIKELLAAEDKDPLDIADVEPPLPMSPELQETIDRLAQGEQPCDVETMPDGERTTADSLGDIPILAASELDVSSLNGIKSVIEQLVQDQHLEVAPHSPSVQRAVADLIGRIVALAAALLEGSLKVSVQQWRLIQAAFEVAMQRTLMLEVLSTIAHTKQELENSGMVALGSSVPSGRNFLFSGRSASEGKQMAVAPSSHEGQMAPFVMSEGGYESGLSMQLLLCSGRGRPVIQALQTELHDGASQLGRVEHIPGRLAAFDAAMELLTRAATRMSPGVTPCVLTWYLDDNVYAETPGLLREWISALRRLLDRGWTIQHVIRSPHNQGQDQSKAIAVVDYLHALLGAPGRYEPYFVSVDPGVLEQQAIGDSHVYTNEYVIVPDLGALVLNAPGGVYVTHARFISPGNELDALIRRFRVSTAGATCVYKACHRWPDEGYQKRITELEEKPGERFVVIDGLSDSVVPFVIHRQRAEKLCERYPERAAAITQMLAWQKRRVGAVLRNMQAYRYFDVTSCQAIERLVREGKYQAEGDIWTALGAEPLTRSQVKLLLTAIIRRLQTHQGYHLFLLNDRDAELCRREFLVKAGNGVFAENWLADAQGQSVRADIEIVDPALVEAYTKAIWHDVSARAERRKDQVIAYLQRHVDALSHC